MSPLLQQPDPQRLATPPPCQETKSFGKSGMGKWGVYVYAAGDESKDVTRFIL